MIQRYIFDSSTMDIKKLSNSILIFVTKRLIEISGIIIAILGILLFNKLLKLNNIEITGLLKFQFYLEIIEEIKNRLLKTISK